MDPAEIKRAVDFILDSKRMGMWSIHGIFRSRVSDELHISFREDRPQVPPELIAAVEEALGEKMDEKRWIRLRWTREGERIRIKSL